MTSPKLRMLERQLSRQVSEIESTSPETGLSGIIKAIQDAVKGEADEAIKAAQSSQQAAVAELSRTRGEAEQAHKELDKALMLMHEKMEALHASTRQQWVDMTKQNAQEMQQLQNRLMAMQQELANEQKARVQAEAECKATKEKYSAMEQMTAKLQVVKPVQTPVAPVVVPAATPMKPLTMRVSQRDVNGHILAISIAPST